MKSLKGGYRGVVLGRGKKVLNIVGEISKSA